MAKYVYTYTPVLEQQTNKIEEERRNESHGQSAKRDRHADRAQKERDRQTHRQRKKRETDRAQKETDTQTDAETEGGWLVHYFLDFNIPSIAQNKSHNQVLFTSVLSTSD